MKKETNLLALWLSIIWIIILILFPILLISYMTLWSLDIFKWINYKWIISNILPIIIIMWPILYIAIKREKDN